MGEETKAEIKLKVVENIEFSFLASLKLNLALFRITYLLSSTSTLF